MKLLSALFLFSICVGCLTTKIVKSTSGELNGTWIPVKEEFGGNELPASSFEKQRLILQDTLYTVTAESIDKGIVYYGNGKMDIYGKVGVNAGKHITAIYKLENGLLTICYNLLGLSYPESYDTKGKPTFFLSVSKKEGIQ
ncbi:MAG: hypothetical protein ABIQ02_00980 [Saprospiraceae bacterium]